jgi:hypothetical protein
LSLVGSFSSMSTPDLIQWARTARRGGAITARNPADNVERKIHLHDGQIVACSSNDPRDYYGNYILKLGYCSEEDVNRALAIQRETGVMVARILVMVEKISKEDAVATLTEKTIDNICDIFLWETGDFVYEHEEIAPAQLIEISIDPISVALEGVRRVDGWNRLRTRFHPETVLEPTGLPLPAGGQFTNLRVARAVLASWDGERTLDDVCRELPFSRYLVLEACSDLDAAGTVRASDRATEVGRERRVQAKMAEALAAQKQGNLAAAVQILEGLEALHRDVPGLAEALARAKDGFKHSVYETAFRREDVPVVAIGSAALERLKLTPSDGFVVSRIDGRLSVAEVIRISSLNEMDALRSLKRLLEAKVIDFPSRRRR